MKVSIIGAGYVGLVASACFAKMSNEVICVDNDLNKLSNLTKGIIPIYEPGLSVLVKEGLARGNLTFTNNLPSAVKQADVCILALPTPQGKNGNANLSYLYRAVKSVAKAINGYKVIVNKSTVPVGTADIVTQIIKNHTTYPFDVISNPEFLRQGSSVNDFLYPERIIIGSDSLKATNIVKHLYESFDTKKSPIYFMSVRSAELTKQAANAFLAIKLSYANEIANLCELVGADSDEVKMGICSDSRIGAKFFNAGIGYGGSCLKKDTQALMKTAKSFGYKLNLPKSAEQINDSQRYVFINKIINKFGGKLEGKVFAIWGLSFKPNTDDIREAPSIEVINTLLGRGVKMQVFDYKAMENIKSILGNKVVYAKNMYDAINNADALLILTEWDEFKQADLLKIKTLLKTPIIFDGRRLYDNKLLLKHGFQYFYIGGNRNSNLK